MNSALKALHTEGNTELLHIATKEETLPVGSRWHQLPYTPYRW